MTNKAELHKALKKYFGFDKFKGDQEAIITRLLDGGDAFVLMPTGGGKSLCYQLPSLMMEGTAIVVSPLIALMKNQVDVITHISETPGTAHYINSSQGKATIEQVRTDIREGRTKLLYVAPESLNKAENIEFFKTVKISFFAIDEAHCISEWGHDFRTEYRNIRPTIDQIGRAPIIALTATATDKVRTDIKKNLGIADAPDFKSSFNRPNLYYEVRQKTKDVDKDIVRFIRKHPGKSGIIYCLSRKKVEDLAEILRANDIKAAPYHAGLDGDVRSATQDDFLMERIDVICATIAFGMGIDKPDVRYVIHYDIPKSLEGYYQETGRAGRDGGEGLCLAFYSHKDLQKLEKFMDGKPVSEQDIGRQLLLETQAYAETSVCRRKMLLHYFGEEYHKDNCGNCDNCLHKKEQIEVSAELVIALTAIAALKEDFRADYIIDFVSGKASEDILLHKHERHELFASGADSDPKVWNPLIRQALLAGFLKKEVENYGLLKLTAEGKRYLKKPKPFMIVLDNEFDEDASDYEGGTSELDPTLSAMLKDLRRKVSKQLERPPYVIFQDTSIEQMATTYPITLEDLKDIQGVGEGKVKQPYAKQFIDLIRRYCEENDIVPQSIERVRTTPKRSEQTVKIIACVDRQIDLLDVAKAENIEFEELLDKLEAIVYSGSRLNIDYFINENIDSDLVDDVYEFFRTSETDDLEPAIEEFADDFPEDEIEVGLRLIRIKFISEMQNS